MNRILIEQLLNFRRNSDIRRESWDISWTQYTDVSEYTGLTFIEWEKEILSKRYDLWIDFMWQWIDKSSICKKRIPVCLSNDSREGLNERIKDILNDSNDYWDLIPADPLFWDVYKKDTWKRLISKVDENWWGVDIIFVRPWWWYNFANIMVRDKSDLDKVYANIIIRFKLIERLYSLLKNWSNIYIEVPITFW